MDSSSEETSEQTVEKDEKKNSLQSRKTEREGIFCHVYVYKNYCP